MKSWLAEWILALLVMMPACASPEDGVDVSVHSENDHFVLSAHFVVPVPVELAWGVLIDFEHMPAFLPNLKESHVLFHNGNSLRVEQKGAVPFALFHINYDSIRDIDLYPMVEIHSKTVGGDSGQTQSVSSLKSAGNQTEINYRADWWPASKTLASMNQSTTHELLRSQFFAMQQEMLRRLQAQK